MPPPSRSPSRGGRVGFSGIGRSTPMACQDGGLATVERREPASSDRLPVHRSKFQPAIPRRVAPQQSPLPLHQSPRILAQSQIRRRNQMRCSTSAQAVAPRLLVAPALAVSAARSAISTLRAGCHFYLAPTSRRSRPLTPVNRKRTPGERLFWSVGGPKKRPAIATSRLRPGEMPKMVRPGRCR